MISWIIAIGKDGKLQMWKLFLDDLRNPQQIYPKTYTTFTVARSFQEALDLLTEKGCPSFISFDHDLSDEHYHGDFSRTPTGLDFAWRLISIDLDMRGGGKAFIPDEFSYAVHSMNPVGAANIRGALESYFKFRGREGQRTTL